MVDLEISRFLAAVDPPRFSSIPAISVPKDFQLTSVDENLRPNGGDTDLEDLSPLPGALRHFNGTYVGCGFNTIFRPSSKENRDAAANNPALKEKEPLAKVETGSFADDNLLELNLTIEALVFTPNQIGNIPNRGMNPQADTVLRGVPYVQTVFDVTDAKNGTLTTGKDPSQQRGIHLEPGIFLFVPDTTTPSSKATVCRMASIPHGTTINASGLAPPPEGVAVPPSIKPLDNGITPSSASFTVEGGVRKFKAPIPQKFPSLTVTSPNPPRLPQDLTSLSNNKVLTQELLDNPHKLLSDINAILTKDNRITKSWTFTVATPSAQFGGGLGNIPFLSGGSNPSADVTTMSSTFWISEVQYNVAVPAVAAGQVSAPLSPTNLLPGAKLPKFVVMAPKDKAVQAKTVTLTAIQIQYSQKVNLRFQPATVVNKGTVVDWPHVSVAHLLPLAPVKVDLFHHPERAKDLNLVLV